MKKIKKPISILLSVLMVLSVFAVVPFTASAAELADYVMVQNLRVGDILGGDVRYLLNSGNYTLTLEANRYGNYFGKKTEATVTSSFDFTEAHGSDPVSIYDMNGYNKYYPYDENGNRCEAFIVTAVDHSAHTFSLAGYREPDNPVLLNSSVKYRYCDGTAFHTGNTPAASTYKVDTGNRKWTNNSWYVVTENVTFEKRIEITGTVNLVLCDGATLTAKQGISVNNGDYDPRRAGALNIYAQNGGTGALYAGTANGTSTTMKESPQRAAIGGDDNKTNGDITIHGGNIYAISNIGTAGIGGGQNSDGGNVTIYGGNVTAGNQNSYGSGIGGGYWANAGNINILGGTVTAFATGEENDAAFGTISTDRTVNLTIPEGATMVAGDNADSAVATTVDEYKANRKVYARVEAGKLPDYYTVDWKNDDGSILKTKEFAAGTTPTYDGTTPTKADDDNAYTFTGWTPALAPVTADATYTATFDATPYVASVTSGGTVTYYSSLKEAITAAPNGSTVTLLKDVTETQTAYANNNDTYGGTGNVISGKTITITSNGTGSDRKTVTGSRFDVKNGGNVTFTNIIIDGGVADSAHKITSYNSWSNYFMVVSYGSTLTFDTGATVQNYYAAAHGVIDVGNGRRGNLDTSNGSSTINIKDGSEFKNLGANYGVFREDYKSTINMSGGSVTNCTSFANEGVCAYVAQGSAFNMTGGEITGCSPEGSAPGLIFLHDGQANGNNKFTMTGGTISGNTAKLGGAVYSHNVNNTVTVGGSAVATGNTGTDINNGQSGSSNFYLAAGQTMTFVNDNHLSGDSLIGIYSATAPTDSADAKIATGAVKEDIKHIHSDLPGNAGIIYCDGEKDWIWYNNQFVEVSCHHTSHQGGTVWLSTAVNTYEVTFDTDGGTPATIPAQTVVSNSKATKPADPTKDGYVFDGWYNGDTEFDFDTPITAETNLKAKWSVPVASVTVGGTTTEYTDFAEAVNAWVNNSTLTLLANVTTSSVIRFESGTKTLDLNGYGIKNTSANYNNSNSVIFIRGSGTQLTLQDSRPNETTHYFTAPTGNAGLATDISDIDSGNQQSFHGGYLTGGNCFSGGGIRVDNGANLIMTGGTIIGNRGQYGGGIDVEKSGSAGGSATISGGAIMYNYGTNYNGAIHTNQANYVSVSNCKITNNYAEHGAGGAYKSSINGGFSGNLIIKDNKTGNTECNVLIESNQYISLTSELGENASIGITMNNPGVFTNSADTSLNDASKFLSDNSSYAVHKNDAGQLYLSQKLIAGHTLSLDGNIAINFYLNPAAAGMTANQVTADNFSYSFAWADVDKLDGKPLVSVSDQAKSKAFRVSNDGKYIIVTCHVCAAEMSCGVNASFTLGEKTESEVYSVRQYGDEVFNATDEEIDERFGGAEEYGKLTDLMTKMLDYGAKAQTVFGIKTGDPANTGLDYTMSSDTPDFDEAIQTANGSTADDLAELFGKNFKAPSLVFLDYSTLKLYFENKDGSLSTSGLTKWNNYYYIKQENIAASQLDTLQTFTVSGKTFRYSALDYAKVLAASENADNANLAKALYWYNQAANAYFG